MMMQNIKAESAVKMEQAGKKWEIDYYIFIDYSERLVGYIVVEKDEVQGLLPKISKLRHYKDIKHKKSYIQAAKNIFEKNRIIGHILKCKIKELKDNLSVFVEVIDFVGKHDNCRIFASVDNNQFNSFKKLLDIVPHQQHTTIVKESELKKGSAEYRMSLIIDTMLNIKRVSK